AVAPGTSRTRGGWRRDFSGRDKGVSVATSVQTGRQVAVAVRAEAISKVYGAGETRVVALDAVDVAFAAGEFTALMGPSGSGKPTLMPCAAGLDTVSAGRVLIGDTEITGLRDKQLTRLRRDRIGFVFQSFNLLPTLSARENITLPLDLAGR